MPLYEFQCLDCGENFEERRTFAESSKIAECAHCESTHTVKLFGAVMVLNGKSQSRSEVAMGPSQGFGGGCCGGGGCGCH